MTLDIFTRMPATAARQPRLATARRLVACALIALCGSASHAAGTRDHGHDDAVTEVWDGTWTATFDRSVGATGTARLVLADFDGTWQDLGPADRLKTTACSGKRMPVTVQLSKKEEFAFTVFGSSVSPKCPDLSIHLKPVDAKTLEGTVESKQLGGEQRIRLVRSPQAPRKR